MAGQVKQRQKYSDKQVTSQIANEDMASIHKLTRQKKRP